MKKDRILKKLLSHDILHSKYGMREQDIPTSYYVATKSDCILIQTIVILVDEIEKGTKTDSALYEKVKQFLNVHA